MSRFAKVLSIALAVSVFAGILGVGPAHPASGSPQVGVQFHCMWSSYTYDERRLMLDKLAAAGVTTVRIDMGWSSFQETSRTTYSQWYIDRADFCVNEARARGMSVLSVVHRTPGWANGGQGTGVPPTDLNDFANFSEWLARHFAGRIVAYEVWNEPDPDQSFWLGTVEQYVSMLKLAYPRFKAGDPAAKVVLGGPSSNDDRWIGQVYALGAKSSFDIVATHPYQGYASKEPEYPDDGNRWWFTHFPAVLSVMQQYGDGAKEVWFTEFGWSSHENTSDLPNWMQGVTPEQQADYLVRAVKLAGLQYPNVTRMFWYNERNRTNGNIQHNNFGLLRADFSEKPAYVALKNHNNGLSVADILPPLVTITNPRNLSTVTGRTDISARAVDDRAVVKMEILIDGTVRATASAASMSYTWNTKKTFKGLHYIVVRAYDASNNVGLSTVTVVV